MSNMDQSRLAEFESGLRPLTGLLRTRDHGVRVGRRGIFLGSEYGVPFIYWHYSSSDCTELEQTAFQYDRIIRSEAEQDRFAVGRQQQFCDATGDLYYKWLLKEVPPATPVEKFFWGTFLSAAVFLALTIT